MSCKAEHNTVSINAWSNVIILIRNVAIFSAHFHFGEVLSDCQVTKPRLHCMCTFEKILNSNLVRQRQCPLYGCEAWTITTKSCNTLQTSEQNFFKQWNGRRKADHRRNKTYNTSHRFSPHRNKTIKQNRTEHWEQQEAHTERMEGISTLFLQRWKERA
jgi:hypothetical protein